MLTGLYCARVKFLEIQGSSRDRGEHIMRVFCYIHRILHPHRERRCTSDRNLVRSFRLYIYLYIDEQRSGPLLAIVMQILKGVVYSAELARRSDAEKVGFSYMYIDRLTRVYVYASIFTRNFLRTVAFHLFYLMFLYNIKVKL